MRAKEDIWSTLLVRRAKDMMTTLMDKVLVLRDDRNVFSEAEKLVAIAGKESCTLLAADATWLSDRMLKDFEQPCWRESKYADTMEIFESRPVTSRTTQPIVEERSTSRFIQTTVWYEKSKEYTVCKWTTTRNTLRRPSLAMCQSFMHGLLWDESNGPKNFYWNGIVEIIRTRNQVTVHLRR